MRCWHLLFVIFDPQYSQGWSIPSRVLRNAKAYCKARAQASLNAPETFPRTFSRYNPLSDVPYSRSTSKDVVSGESILSPPSRGRQDQRSTFTYRDMQRTIRRSRIDEGMNTL